MPAGADADAAPGPRSSRRRVRVAGAAVALAALPMLLVLAALALAWLEPQPEIWSHLARHLLGPVLLDTLLVVAGTGVASATLGTALAALVTLTDFPGRRWLEVGLALPLALPAYVLAFVYVSSVDAGSGLRALALALTGSTAWLPGIRHPAGAVLVLSLAFYPYTYLLVRAALKQHGRGLFETARALGAGPYEAFARGVLPALRPALAAGVGLAALEALADFGAVAVLGVDTLGIAIHRTWFGLGSLGGAAQLAGALLLLALMVAQLERASRGGARYAAASAPRPFRPARLVGGAAFAALALAGGTFALGFALPVARLLAWLWQGPALDARLADAAARTAGIAGGGALLIMTLGAVLALARRGATGGSAARAAAELALLGYAVPGAVLAAALMLALVAIERAAGAAGLLSSAIAGVWLALLARFLRVGADAVESGLAPLKPSLGEAARALGAGPVARLLRVRLPLLAPALGVGALLAFIECAKELPATMMLRPFGWDTLAILVYNASSEGLWAQAAAPALLLAALGLVPALALLKRAPA